MASAPKPDTRASLTRETWVEAATDVLQTEGIDAVRVDVLARQLGVTRGSFYWHFKDREELLRAVLHGWMAMSTEALTARLESASADPREQLRDVLSLPQRGRSARHASNIELSIRAWARRDELARQAVDAADAARIGYIAQIFSGLGFAPAEARHRAFMVYSLNLACALVAPSSGAPKREEFLGFAGDLLSAPKATA